MGKCVVVLLHQIKNRSRIKIKGDRLQSNHSVLYFMFSISGPPLIAITDIIDLVT